MRVILAVSLAVVLAGCAVATSSGGPSTPTVAQAPAGTPEATADAGASADTGTSTEPPTAEPSPTEAPAAIPLTDAPPVAFSGKTSKNTKAFTTGAPLRVDYTFKGDGNFIVTLTGTDGLPIGSIANRIGRGSATTWVYSGGGVKAYFDVLANGPWTLKATAVVPPISSLPLVSKGTTDLVTAPFPATGTLTVNWSFQGDGNFIVSLVDPTSGQPIDSIANVIGKSTESTELYNHEGPVALDVLANGPWTITVASTP